MSLLSFSRSARAILEKHGAEPMMLADVHMRLAEVHEESDNIIDAISEYERALTIRKAHLEPHSRLVAEVYSCMAFDYALEKRNTEAIESYKKAAECIEKQLANLEEQASSSDSEVRTSATTEIAELREVFADLKERVRQR